MTEPARVDVGRPGRSDPRALLAVRGLDCGLSTLAGVPATGPRERACYRCRVVRRHRRFELVNVTLDRQPIGSCTIDAWEDDDGREQWTARVLMKTGHGSSVGVLHGATRAGQLLAGHVRFAADQQGPRGGRTVLVELHGQGPLEPAEPIPPADPVEETDAAGAAADGTPPGTPAASGTPAAPGSSAPQADPNASADPRRATA